MAKSKFSIYRYHLTPVTTRQAYEFDETLTRDKVIENKNVYFGEVLNSRENLENLQGKILPHELYFDNSELLIWRIGNRRNQAIIDSKFMKHYEDNYPFIHVVFKNEAGNQYMAIEHNSKAFAKSDDVVRILQRHLSLLLKRKGLTLQINPVVEEKEFWSLLDKYKGRIKQATFVISVNESHARSTFKEEFKNLATSTNSAKSEIQLEAPEDEVLENLTPENAQFNDVAKLVQEGNTEMSFRATGVRYKVTTKDVAKELQIDKIEGKSDRTIREIAKLFNSLK